MITVTDSAKEYLKNILLAHTGDPEISLRLVGQPGEQLSFVLGKEAEGDQVVEHSGIKVLLVERELVPLLEGLTIDVQDTPDGPKLAIFGEQQR